MRVLIGCEESQTLTRAFRDAGHTAYSCDLLPTRGNPDWHFKTDIHNALEMMPWDLIVLHPDCRALAVSGNPWYGSGRPLAHLRTQSIHWTGELWRRACRLCDHVALENPVSVIFQYLEAPVCYVQPWEHGHGETKRTGFALHNLPPLQPSKVVEGREQRIWKMPPSATRSRDRSVTYPGIAAAIVQQWADAAQD